MKLLVALLLFASVSHAEETGFSQKAIGWQGIGASTLLAPDEKSESFSITVPIHVYGLDVQPDHSMSAYEVNSGLEFGNTIAGRDLRFLMGLDFDARVGAGAHTSGPLMLYGLGTGGLKTVFRMNGLPENELGFSAGLESGVGVSGDRLLVTAGGIVDARTSILNPEGDYAEIDAGARIRLALKDLLYFRVEYERSVGRTRGDVAQNASLTLDYRLPPGFRPWTPSLKVMVGADARFARIENGDLSNNRYSVGVHLTFYKEPK